MESERSFRTRHVGKHFSDLGDKLLIALTKLMTMSSADFLDEWFDSEVLKATMSASGIIGTFMGPRSPGTAYVFSSLYGRVGWRVSFLGICPRRHGNNQSDDRRCGAPFWRGDSHGGGRRPRADQEWPRLLASSSLGEEIHAKATSRSIPNAPF